MAHRRGPGAPRYVASQGTAPGRAGRVHVEQDGRQIWIGGSSVTCMRGEVPLVSGPAPCVNPVVVLARIWPAARPGRTLGVAPAAGAHPLMGTHNRS